MRSAPVGTNDMMALVVANLPRNICAWEGTKSVCMLVYFGCFCDSPHGYEYDRLF